MTELTSLLEEVQTITDQMIPLPDDIGGQVQHLEFLSNLKWNVSELMPKAKALYNDALAEVSEQLIEKHKDLSPSTLNNLIKGKLGIYQKPVDILDRVNSTINLQSNNLRTVISFKKGGY